jgi:hypothetical protein
VPQKTMMKSYNIILVFFCLGLLCSCDNQEKYQHDRTSSGRLTLSSALFLATIRNYPIGLTKKMYFTKLMTDDSIKKYYGTDSLFKQDNNNFIRGLVIYSNPNKYQFPLYSLAFQNDTCIGFMLVDSLKRESYVKAWILSASSVYGEYQTSTKTISHFNPDKKVVTQKCYTWKKIGNLIQISYSEDDSLYGVSVCDTFKLLPILRENHLGNIFDE